MVAFQATLELMAKEFPGAITGYKLEVTESHKRQKADTSGTAKAVVASIAKLGAPITEVRVQKFPCSLTTSCRAMMTQNNGTALRSRYAIIAVTTCAHKAEWNMLTRPEAADLQLPAGVPAGLSCPKPQQNGRSIQFS